MAATTATAVEQDNDGRRIMMEEMMDQYDISLPIERGSMPPASWYTSSEFFQFVELPHVFHQSSSSNPNNNWIAVGVVVLSNKISIGTDKDDHQDSKKPGWYQTGSVKLGNNHQEQPYLLCRSEDGTLQAFANVCTHAGSCLVGPWTNHNHHHPKKKKKKDDRSGATTSTAPFCPNLTSELVGQDVTGNLLLEPTACSSDDDDDDEQQQQQRRNKEKRRPTFACPYHGWEFNLKGQLVKSTNMKGIQNFRPKDHGLKPIPLQTMGPIIFLQLSTSTTNNSDHDHDHHDGNNDAAERNGEDKNNNKNKGELEEEEEDRLMTHKSSFMENRQLLQNRLEANGFAGDFSDVCLVQTQDFVVQCNWKVFCDNYGDGCYHCSYAHADLVSLMDEGNYRTEVCSPEMTIQYAPPAASSSSDDTNNNNNNKKEDDSSSSLSATERFGTDRAAVFCQWYPNIMINRYGPWLDLDIVLPIDEQQCIVRKAWFLEHDKIQELQKSSSSEVGRRDDDAVQQFIDESLQSSRKVHEEDTFLCENVQRGLNAPSSSRRGGGIGRYVPQQQIAQYNFHHRLVQDYQLYKKK